jgi:hypothetical protein
LLERTLRFKALIKIMNSTRSNRLSSCMRRIKRRRRLMNSLRLSMMNAKKCKKKNIDLSQISRTLR